MNNLTIEPLTKSNFGDFDFKEFFSDYKNEKFYQDTLRINSKTFIIFQVDKLNNSLQNERAKFWVIYNQSKQVTTVFGINKEHNQSNLYEKEIYTLAPFYNFKKEQSLAFSLAIQQIEKFIKEIKVDTIRTKIRTIDHVNISHFEDEHFHYYAGADKVFFDIRKISRSPFYDRNSSSIRKFETTRLTMREFCQGDLEDCLKLLSQHQKNEKYYNQKVAKIKTDELFKKWFISKTENQNYKIHVLIDNEAEKIAGLTLFFKPEFFNKYLNGQTLYSPDLIIIHEIYKNTSAAYLIISTLLSELKVSIEGQTMADNFKLQSFVTRIGFVVVDSFVFLEKCYT